MADAYAVPADVAAIWRPLTPAEVIAVNARIDQASAIVRSEVPTVDDRIDAGTLDRAVVSGVVADMVRRVMLNPDGVRQRSRSIDDYQESVTVDSSVSESALYLTAREYRLLANSGSGRGNGQKAFMINPGTPVFW